MKIAIATSGTRGDAQPFVALGAQLRARGHDAILVTHEEFRPLAESHGLGFRPLYGDPKAVIASEGFRRMLSGNPVTMLRAARQMTRHFFPRYVEDGLKGYAGADLVVCGLPAPCASFAAEKLGIPHLFATLQPLTRSRHHVAALADPAMPDRGAFLNAASHRVVEQAIWQPMRGVMNELRRGLGLPVYPFAGNFPAFYTGEVPLLCAYSAAVIPPAADHPAPHHVTGFWFLDDAPQYTPGPDLARFLADGPAPVYIGFGSMIADPDRLNAAILGAAKETGLRILVHKGWAGLAEGDLPKGMLAIGSVPHDWLFRHVAAVVHHGGAGTTAAGLRAGAPTLVAPFGMDQGMWGGRVASIGAGPKPIPQKNLTAANLAAALREATESSALRAGARRVADVMAREDGAAEAARIVEEFASKAVRRAS